MRVSLLLCWAAPRHCSPLFPRHFPSHFPRPPPSLSMSLSPSRLHSLASQSRPTWRMSVARLPRHFRRLPLTEEAAPPPHHTLSTRRSSPNNFSSAAHLAIFPAAIHPPECHALFALLVKFNVKSIGKRKTMAAIEPTAGKWIKDTKNNNTAF